MRTIFMFVFGLAMCATLVAAYGPGAPARSMLQSSDEWREGRATWYDHPWTGMWLLSQRTNEPTFPRINKRIKSMTTAKQNCWFRNVDNTPLLKTSSRWLLQAHAATAN
jgi:hypothetical protein